LSKTSISDRTSPDSINGDRRVNPAVERLGGWLFRHRTSLPLPIALAMIVIPGADAPNPPLLAAIGVAVTAAGEAVRLWAVHHIGAISRTRSDRLGPLVDRGPFGFVRNPLYLGNIAIWVGFSITARLVWLAPVVLVLLGAEYHAIVRWEERLLESRLGGAYRDYVARVPRWIPTVHRRQSTVDRRLSAVNRQLSVSSWRDTLFSERGTLLAMAAGYLLLWSKARF
jgi:protein-S-isoprenylcysteine O-methyltransferase Ste14